MIVRDEEGKLLLLSKGADRFVIIYPKTLELLLLIPLENPYNFLSHAVSCLKGLPKMVGILKMQPRTM